MVERAIRPELELDKERLKDVVFTAIEARHKGKGIFQGGYKSPEAPFIDLLKNNAYIRFDPWLTLNAVFFYMTTLFGTDSTRQLKRAADPEIFANTSDLYLSHKVVEMPDEEIMRLGKELINQGGYNIKAIEEWKYNAKIVHEQYWGSVENYFEKFGYDAPTILNDLVFAKEQDPEKNFKRYGVKLAKLLLLWVDHYGLTQERLKRLNKIGIQVDFQVARLCVQSGALKLPGPVRTDLVMPVLNIAFEEFCEKYCNESTGLTQQYVSETLWYVGHVGCNQFRHLDCPLLSLCSGNISRKPYDRTGLIDPTSRGFKTRAQVYADIRGRRLRKQLLDKGQLELNM